MNVWISAHISYSQGVVGHGRLSIFVDIDKQGALERALGPSGVGKVRNGLVRRWPDELLDIDGHTAGNLFQSRESVLGWKQRLESVLKPVLRRVG